VIPNTFGESAPFSLGVEEELMILDASTHEQVAAVNRIPASRMDRRGAEDGAVRVRVRDEH
jgi:hypothetical protein